MTLEETNAKIDSMITRLENRILQLDQNIEEYRLDNNLRAINNNTIKRNTFQLILNDLVSNFK